MWSAKAAREEEPGEAEQEKALNCRSRGEIMNRFCASFKVRNSVSLPLITHMDNVY